MFIHRHILIASPLRWLFSLLEKLSGIDIHAATPSSHWSTTTVSVTSHDDADHLLSSVVSLLQPDSGIALILIYFLLFPPKYSSPLIDNVLCFVYCLPSPARI